MQVTSSAFRSLLRDAPTDALTTTITPEHRAEGLFYCPRCHRRAWENFVHGDRRYRWQDSGTLLDGPKARFIDAFTWRCCRCDASGYREEVERIIATTPLYRDTFMELYEETRRAA